MSSTPPPPTHSEVEPVAVSNDERTWGMLCHLSALAGYFVPFASIVAPLVIWLVKKDQLPFVDDQGKEAVNFQISVLVYLIVSGVLIFVIVGIFLLLAVLIFDLAMIIVAAIKANQGIAYRYPLCIRLIS